MPQSLSWTDIAKIAFLFLLGYVTILIMQHNEPFILSGVNLVFHEAGHPIFSLFGEFIGFLGGTLGQLIIPIIVGGYFWRQHDWYGLSFAIWWLGDNFVNVGIYMSDASAQILPLIGGEHDWAYLFGATGLLNHDTAIGGATIILGNACMWGALVFGIAQLLLIISNAARNTRPA